MASAVLLLRRPFIHSTNNSVPVRNHDINRGRFPTPTHSLSLSLSRCLYLCLSLSLSLLFSLFNCLQSHRLTSQRGEAIFSATA